MEEKDIEVVEILLQLPRLIAVSENRMGLSISWGAKKIRGSPSSLTAVASLSNPKAPISICTQITNCPVKKIGENEAIVGSNEGNKFCELKPSEENSNSCTSVKRKRENEEANPSNPRVADSPCAMAGPLSPTTPLSFPPVRIDDEDSMDFDNLKCWESMPTDENPGLGSSSSTLLLDEKPKEKVVSSSSKGFIPDLNVPLPLEEGSLGLGLGFHKMVPIQQFFIVPVQPPPFDVMKVKALLAVDARRRRTQILRSKKIANPRRLHHCSKSER